RRAVRGRDPGHLRGCRVKRYATVYPQDTKVKEGAKSVRSGGIDLLDYYTAHALTGLLASRAGLISGATAATVINGEQLASAAVLIGEATMEALEKRRMTRG